MSDSATVSRSATKMATPAAPVHPARSGPFSARYATTVLIMIAAALSLHGLASWAGVHFRKQAVPLKKPLFQMDIARFKPLYDLHPVQEAPLSQEQLDPLGTDEYLNWRLVDRRKDPSDAARVASIFVTYFTGKPDQVPHVPEECMVASGMRLLSDTVQTLNVAGVGAPEDQLAVRLLEFELPTAGRGYGLSSAAPRMTILYFFIANGQYLKTRSEVRRSHMNPFDRYAYYAKVELRFSDDGGRSDVARKWADRETIAQAAPPLLQRLLTALREDHFQDWQSWTRQAPTQGGPAGTAPPAGQPRGGN